VTATRTENSFSERLRRAVGDWHIAVTEDRSTRAALRRAQNIDDVPLDALADLTTRVVGRVGDDPAAHRRTEQLARIALAVGEIDQDVDSRLGRLLGTRRPGSTEPRLSDKRLRLLLDTPEVDLFVRLLRGALVQVERRAPIVDTALLVWRWHHPDARADARRRLALHYFQADLADAALGETP
jgi:CRISPR type I-E-associated protein CasB/Cse2